MKTRLKFLAEVSVKGLGKYVALSYAQIFRDTKEFNKHFRSVKNRQAGGVADQVSSIFGLNYILCVLKF